ncbi:MAG: hypothetical protein ACFFCQ_12200 [Promethearchaeota archaeon]
MNQTKRKIEKLEPRAQFFFFTTLNGLENIINQSAPVFFQKKRKGYYGIQILTTKYPVPLNLVYKGITNLGFLKKLKSIIYGIEFSWGIPEIRPWFIINVNLLKKNKFGVSRISSSFWEKIQQKRFIPPRSINQLLRDLNTSRQIRDLSSTLVRAVEPLKPKRIALVCTHKPEIIEKGRPNLALSFEFKLRNGQKIGPENSPVVWNEVVTRCGDLFMVTRNRCEAYRTLYF